MSRANPTERVRADPDELEKLAEEIREQTDEFEDIATRFERTAEHLRRVYADE